ncbi:MAG TPA: hypothetical protein VIU12_17205 [Chryseolinea sp.]
MTEDEYIKLYEKYLAGQCTPEEEKIIKAFQDESFLEDRPWDTETLGDQQEMEQLLLERLQHRLLPSARAVETNNVRWLFWRYAAAILLIGLSSYGLYMYYRPVQMNKDLTRRLYPIPSTELKTNPNLRPNPGY